MTAQATLALKSSQYQNIKQIIADAEKEFEEAKADAEAK